MRSDYPDYVGGLGNDAWQATICCAVMDALKKMPILNAQ